MPKTLVNVNTGDNYTDQGGANINSVFQSNGGWVVVGAQVYCQMQHSLDNATQGSEQWGEEFLLPSGAHTIDKLTTGIRFRSSSSGNPVQVNAAIFYRNEPSIAVGGFGVSAPGSSVAALNFQHNDVAVATEPTADFEDSATVTLTPVDDPVNTRVKITGAIPSNVALPGAPTTTTAATADNSTKIATTAYVQNQGYVTATTAPVTSVDGRTGAVTGLADLTSASVQVFTGAISTSPTTGGFGQDGIFLSSGTTGTIWVAAPLATNSVWVSSVNGDTERRFNILAGGNLSFGPGNAAVDTTMARSGVGLFTQILGSGIGYGTGTGGTSTGNALGAAVTINKATGTIVYNSGSVINGATSSTTLTNSTVGITDVVVVTPSIGGAVGSPVSATARITAAGSVIITLVNNSGATINAATNNVTIAFAILKTATS